VTSNYADITNVTIREGRFITQADDDQRRNVIVIGVNAADALFPGKQQNIAGNRSAHGWLQFRDRRGVREAQGRLLWRKRRRQCRLYAFTHGQKVAPARGYLLFVIKARSGQLNDALTQTEDILRRRRNVKFGDPNNFDVKTADNFVKQFDSITAMVGLIANRDFQSWPSGRRHRRDEHHAGECD
jgi:putative ABC transport system permease protein